MAWARPAVVRTWCCEPDTKTDLDTRRHHHLLLHCHVEARTSVSDLSGILLAEADVHARQLITCTYRTQQLQEVQEVQEVLVMNVMFERCAGLDVHKQSVVACRMLSGLGTRCPHP